MRTTMPKNTLALVLLVVGALVSGGCAAAPAATRSTSSAEDASAEYDALAKDDQAIDALEARLGRELVELGPALEPGDAGAYTAAYRSSKTYSDARASYRTSSDAFAAALRAYLPELDSYATSHTAPRPEPTPTPNQPPTTSAPIYELPPGTRDSLMDDYALLATTPYATDAIAFASHCLEGDTTYARALMDTSNGGWQRSDVIDRILAPALTHATAASLLDTDDADTTLDALRAAAGSAQGFAGGVIAVIDGFHASGDTAWASLEPSIGDSKLGSAITGVGVILALWDLGSFTSDHANDDAVTAFIAVMQTSAASFGAVVDGVKIVRRLTLGAEGAKAFEPLGDAIGRFSAGIGVIADADSSIDDIRKWAGSDAAKIELLGHMLGIASGVLTLCGVSGPLAPVLALASLGVLALADFFEASEEEAAERAAITADETSLLGAVEGFDATLADTFGHGDPWQISSLGRLRLSPQEIRDLARLDPMTVRNTGYTKEYLELDAVGCTFRLTGDQLDAMVLAAAGDGGDAGSVLESFLSYLEIDRSIWESGFDAYLARIQAIAGDSFSSDDERASFGRAGAWVAARAAALKAQPVPAGCEGF